MIIKIFDDGWGQNWPWKQLEMSVVDQMLAPLRQDHKATVVINSVWYTAQRHEDTMAWLRNNPWDQIVLVAMLDAAIPRPEWYAEFDRTILTLGYYPGANELDLCAIFVDQNIDYNSYGDLGDVSAMDTAYMCLNRKPHWHRRRLYARLEELDLLDLGLVSMGSEDGQALRTLATDCAADLVAPNSEVNHYGIPNSVRSLGHPDNWRRHFLNIVTETSFDINRTHFVSEKIYKPIVGERPFIVYDPDGGCAWLQGRGFEPYVDDFKDISDLDLREPANTAPFLRALCDQPRSYWQVKYLALKTKIAYNKNRFGEYVQEQHQIIKRGIQCPI